MYTNIALFSVHSYEILFIYKKNKMKINRYSNSSVCLPLVLNLILTCFRLHVLFSHIILPPSEITFWPFVFWKTVIIASVKNVV